MVKLFTFDTKKICTQLNGIMKNGLCDIKRDSNTFLSGTDNIVGMVTIQPVESYSLSKHKEARPSRFAMIYPFRGQTEKEPIKGVYSTRLLPITEETYMITDMKDYTKKTFIPISQKEIMIIESPSFQENVGGRKEDLNDAGKFLQKINELNKSYPIKSLF